MQQFLADSVVFLVSDIFSMSGLCFLEAMKSQNENTNIIICMFRVLSKSYFKLLSSKCNIPMTRFLKSINNYVYPQ